MGVPLVALGVRPPDIANPLDQYGKAVQLSSMIQQQKLIPGQLEAQQRENEARQQENQIRQTQINDQNAMTTAMHSWDGKDINELPGLMVKHGASANAVMGMKNNIVTQRKSIAEADEATLKNEQTRNDLIAGHFEAVKGAADKQTAYDAAITDLEQKGLLKPGETPHQYPGDDQFALMEKQYMGGKQILEQGIKERETKAKEQEAQARTTSAQTASTRLQAEMPGGAMQPVEQKELSAYLTANPGKTALDFAKLKASFAPQATMNVQMAAGGGLTKEAVDQQAENYWNTGKLPPSRGAAGIAQNRQIMNRAAELHSGESLAAGSAEYKANADSLKKLTGTFNNVTAFENTAGKNLDNFLAQAQKAIDTGLPILNMPARAIAGRLGSDQQAAFDAARTTALTEISKVLSSANASSGVVSDSARHEVESLIKPDATLGQIVSAAKILKQDMGNRHQAYADQIETIKKRLGSKSAAETGFTLPPGAKTATGPNGHKIAVVDGKWVDAQTGKPI